MYFLFFFKPDSTKEIDVKKKPEATEKSAVDTKTKEPEKKTQPVFALPHGASKDKQKRMYIDCV